MTGSSATSAPTPALHVTPERSGHVPAAEGLLARLPDAVICRVIFTVNDVSSQVNMQGHSSARRSMRLWPPDTVISPTTCGDASLQGNTGPVHRYPRRP